MHSDALFIRPWGEIPEPIFVADTFSATSEEGDSVTVALADATPDCAAQEGATGAVRSFSLIFVRHNDGDAFLRGREDHTNLVRK